jgi:hypothetical protein
MQQVVLLVIVDSKLDVVFQVQARAEHRQHWRGQATQSVCATLHRANRMDKHLFRKNGLKYAERSV